jgi:REP element-mobilizing transposase RayT
VTFAGQVECNSPVKYSEIEWSSRAQFRRYIRKEFGEELKRYYWNKPVFWSRSYCIISCGGAPLSVIQQYIEQQEAPH